MDKIIDTIVIGGGQAGLATGYHLKTNNLRFLILEASKESTGSWPNYYDRLKLFSPTRFSSLPGMKFPGDRRVGSVEKDGELFRVRTATGDVFHSKTIVNATGSFHYPYVNPFN